MVSQFELARKRTWIGKNEDVEVALLWQIRKARSQNIILIGMTLQEKAMFFGKALGVIYFICSNDWLSWFKEHNEIVCKRNWGEETVVNPYTLNSFFAEKWPVPKNFHSKTFLMQMECEFFFFFSRHIFHIHLILKGKRILEENWIKRD